MIHLPFRGDIPIINGFQIIIITDGTVGVRVRPLPGFGFSVVGSADAQVTGRFVSFESFGTRRRNCSILVMESGSLPRSQGDDPTSI
ncbi:hypothetical protein GJ744_005357 [Endocarpon pusillum]|uniref:Uncharacterized protein n=1 Tax=Endocarpon pusillum TaxID=364733 RepID=A0A8H7AQ43_9EURO|nr:hypothetical protein GJ744_005357 [Endocarpon pusillum]